MNQMRAHEDVASHEVDLKFLAGVFLRFEAPQAIGETPEGIRFDFMLRGTVDGPELKGRFPLCAAFLLIDPDGIGTISVRAPLLLHDGAVAELEATGRYDFGQNGFQRAAKNDLPNSALGWCPRLSTGHPRYLWLNRLQCLGVGELRPLETRVDYDLFAMTPKVVTTTRAQPASVPASSGWAAPALTPSSRSAEAVMQSAPGAASLYDRLGGKAVVDGIAADFVDALVDNVRLNRQNPRVAIKHAAAKGAGRDSTVKVAGQLFCKLTGGPCEFHLSRPLKDSHAALAITDSDWAIMREALDQVLLKHRVRKPERDELFAIVETTKADIVIPN